MNIRASIDIGSNSTLLLIASIDENKKITVIENESRVTGLGRGLDQHGVFATESMQETLLALTEYAAICKSHKIAVQDVIVTATEASRVAKNAPQFFQDVLDKTGLKITIITGQGEAYYSTAGVLCDSLIKDPEIVIMDIGGASTEIIDVVVASRNINTSFSMPVGVVRMTNWRETNEEFSKLENVFEKFSVQLAQIKTNKLYCVAGTMTSIANMLLGHKEFIESEVHGFEFNKVNLVQLMKETKGFSADDFLDKYPFLGKRSRTIQAGLNLSLKIMEKLGVEKISVSTYGLRYGTLLEGKIKDEYVWKS